MRVMIDTIKLSLRITDPYVLRKGAFTPLSVHQLANAVGSSNRTYLNPTKSYTKIGKYMPRLTLHRRPNKNFGVKYILDIEFSGPKMLYGNNFDELSENDFEKLVKKIQEAVYELTGFRFFKHQIEEAEITAWHPSKNIVFLDYTSSQTILNTISKLDISRIYDLQNTDFRDGHIVHIHTNSKDIAFYDKLADLRKAKVSEKRSIEKNNAIQLNLLEELSEAEPIEVLRYEIRLVGKRSVGKAYPDIKDLTFKNLFKDDLCKRVLIDHWKKLTSRVDMLELDIERPYELLQNYLIENQDVTPRTALAATSGLLIISQVGTCKLRNVLEAHYGKQVWGNVKKILKSPNSYRFRSFVRVDEVLDRFIPIKMSEYKDLLKNSVK